MRFPEEVATEQSILTLFGKARCFTIPVEVNGTLVPGLIDAGATVCAVTESLVNKAD